MKFIFASFMLYFSERDLVSFVSILAYKIDDQVSQMKKSVDLDSSIDLESEENTGLKFGSNKKNQTKVQKIRLSTSKKIKEEKSEEELVEKESKE